jgi:predicted nuclease with TOPRIM domain
MLNLYNLSREYQEAFIELTSNDEFSDAAICDTLEGLEGELKEKMINLASFIKSLEGERGCIDNAMTDMKERYIKINGQIESLRSYLESAMDITGINDIKCEWFDVKLKKNPPSVSIINKDFLPKQYLIEEVNVKIDKSSIRNAIKNGIEVPGATLIQLTRLEIK